MLQCRDIPAIQKHLSLFMGAWPPDALIGEFISKDCDEGKAHFKGRKFLSYRENLLTHKAKMSTLQRSPEDMVGGLDSNGKQLNKETSVKFKFPFCMQAFHPVDSFICSSLNLASECFHEDLCFLGDHAPPFAKDKSGACVLSQWPATKPMGKEKN